MSNSMARRRTRSVYWSRVPGPGVLGSGVLALSLVWLCAPLPALAGGDGESLLAEVQEEDERARQERIRREAQREADTLLDTRSATGRVIQISPRFRVVGTPGFMMGLFLDPHTSHWSGGERNMAFGAEVLLRDPGRQELSFSLDWANLSMPDGYWLQRGDPIRRAEWTELDASVLNADAGIRGVRAFGSAGEWQWYYGAALGLGIVFGSAHETLVDRSRCDPMPERRSTDTSVLLPGGACFDDEGNPVLQEGQRQEASWLWPVLPSVELLTGLRYVIADHYVVSVEAGLRTVYLFAGLTVGYQFQPR